MLYDKQWYVEQFSDILCDVSDSNVTDHTLIIEAFQQAIDSWIEYHQDALNRYRELKNMSDDII